MSAKIAQFTCACAPESGIIKGVLILEVTTISGAAAHPVGAGWAVLFIINYNLILLTISSGKLNNSVSVLPLIRISLYGLIILPRSFLNDANKY